MLRIFKCNGYIIGLFEQHGDGAKNPMDGRALIKDEIFVFNSQCYQQIKSWCEEIGQTPAWEQRLIAAKLPPLEELLEAGPALNLLAYFSEPSMVICN